MVEYEVCPRNPLFTDNPEVKMRASTTSMREVMKDDVRLMRTTMHLTKSMSKEHGSNEKEKEGEETPPTVLAPRIQTKPRMG